MLSRNSKKGFSVLWSRSEVSPRQLDFELGLDFIILKGSEFLSKVEIIIHCNRNRLSY